MDVNMKRRLLMDYVADISNDAEGSKAHEQTRVMTDPMTGTAVGDMSRYARITFT